VPRVRRSPAVLALAVAAGVLVLLVGGAVLAAERPGDTVLPGVEVEGRDVGGQTRPKLAATVEGIAAERLDQPVVVAGERAEADGTRRSVGESATVEATVADAWSRGRGGGGEGASGAGLLTDLPDRLRARFGATIAVALGFDRDEAQVRRWAEQAADGMSAPPRDGAVVIAGPGQVEVTEPRSGAVVDAEDLADRLLDALAADDGPVAVDAPAEATEPAITAADVAAVRPAAERAVSASVELRNPTDAADLALSPAQLARVLSVRADPGAPEGERLVVVADGDALREALGAEAVAAVETQPVEATFSVVGEGVEIAGGTSGFRLDAAAAADRVRDLATGEGTRTGELPGEEVAPSLTRAAAEDLGIARRVSTFTTRYPCCQSRVENIRRFSALLDGAIIRPGERFSLNAHIGERTTARGFVPGGVIQDGRFEEAVGGGVSQVATTFFNAAFFSGLEIVRFQPHSFYIDRYPMGRESTISFGAIDVVIENDSPHAVLVQAAASDTAVTVSFFSTPWAEVVDRTGEPYDRVPGEVRDGFTIDVARQVTYPDGRQRERTWTHTYRPEGALDEETESEAEEAGEDPEQLEEEGT
jgi:vancomycin resistance protein YoaR